jgi:radical SAM protein with 4Fe4S-binding SPASM domain
MKQLSKHVWKIPHKGQEAYYHTITKKWLPSNASETEFEQKYFFEDQEELALNEMIFPPPPTHLSLRIIPTWECKLRCAHCAVNRKLLAKQQEEINIDKIVQFLKRSNLKLRDVALMGGESLLVLQKCNEIIDKLRPMGEDVIISTVASLSYELTEEHFNIIEKMNDIAISIDGFAESHNKQRQLFNPNESIDLFGLVIKNLKILIRKGFKNKIYIKTCLDDEYYNNLLYTRNFCRFLLSFGIPPERIELGCRSPADNSCPISNVFLNGLRYVFALSPCCKYNPTILVTDYTGNIYSDFHSWAVVGTINDNYEQIYKNNLELTRKTIPILHSPKCRNCDIFGFCWGGCSALNFIGGLDKHCNITEIKKTINTLIENDMLIMEN